ncbi:ABC transporter permease [Microbacterium sp. RD1]|uniref:ABC transporter permease n=1 Tax=Microbacterium sp. RD1 TaxID=3457313 RepID=UPI003FA55A6F
MSLVAASRSELTKQFTTSIWWILGLVLLLYIGATATGFGFLLAAVATGALGADTGPAVPADALPPVIYSIATSFGYVFPLLIGTLMVTSEFRHKTLTPTFLATPRRGVVLGAKSAAGVVMGLIFGVLGLAATVVPGAIVLSASNLSTGFDSSDTWALVGRMLGAFVLWTLIGIGVGSVVRNQVVAVVVVLAFTQFVEPIARLAGGFVEGLRPVVNVLPGAASDALVGASAFSISTPTSSGDPLEWWAGGLVLLAYAVVFLVLGLFTSWRRDVN